MNHSLHDLGQDANKLAHERLIDPAKDLIHDAKVAVEHGVHQARSVLAADATLAQESISRLCQKTGRWISANPFTSVSLALVVGVAAATLGRPVRV
jgi:ElaB/YqjD/DUF883 family membrane-anchored ribosome-binding protein